MNPIRIPGTDLSLKLGTTKADFVGEAHCFVFRHKERVAYVTLENVEIVGRYFLDYSEVEKVIATVNKHKNELISNYQCKQIKAN